ncbi:hypothetical protein ACS3UN_07655 [Oscillospiraceae bacterium LTW-04]|nr:hypothetical protein RBH76_02685 [Oscillospiraceae bacterium MB24-C1]
MKKMACFFYIGCAVLLLTACGIRAERPEKLLNRAFESNISVKWCDEDYRGFIRKGNDGILTVTINSETLTEPLIFYYGDGGYGVEQGELSFTAPKESLLSGSLLSSLEQAFIMLPHAEASANGEDLILKAGTAILRCNKSDGTFIDLTLERGYINFSDFAFLN